jgi:adenosylcobinamide-phosphate synthase
VPPPIEPSPYLNVLLAVLALSVEAAVGYPDAIYRALGHPVTWMGAGLGLLEARLNHGGALARRSAGALALLLLLGVSVLPAIWLQAMLSQSAAGFLLLAVLAAALPAQRSLYEHVLKVAAALETGGLGEGRRAVSMIVGRDVSVLDKAGVARAAIESLAENFSDGIVAPVFWLAVAGLPGGVAYKAANTADSMIGHRNERYLYFGWAAARFDDLINLPASRLAALWLVLAASTSSLGAFGAAIAAVRRDAHTHRSPNAGWPEAAMAGALKLRLAGPRVYGGERVEDAYMGSGRRDAGAADIRAALRLYVRACAAQAATFAMIAMAMAWF